MLQQTNTIPTIFVIVADPVGSGFVKSLARPGGNATGIHFFGAETASKQLGLLHELLPKAVRVAVLINPGNASSTESMLHDIGAAAPVFGLQIQTVAAGTVGEIEAAFAGLVRERAEALFIAADGFLISRRVQIATLATRHAIPTISNASEAVKVGQLMSYGADLVDAYRQVGGYAGRIVKGVKPADLPIQQSTKFEFVINASTAKVLGLDVPPALLLRADEVIE
jgi:putative ABC transport system substrate-binding protein